MYCLKYQHIGNTQRCVVLTIYSNLDREKERQGECMYNIDVCMYYIHTYKHTYTCIYVHTYIYCGMQVHACIIHTCMLFRYVLHMYMYFICYISFIYIFCIYINSIYNTKETVSLSVLITWYPDRSLQIQFAFCSILKALFIF